MKDLLFAGMVGVVWAAIFGVACIALLVCGLFGFGIYTWTGASKEGKIAIKEALRDTEEFYRCLWFFVNGGKYSGCPFFKERRETRVRLFGIALTFRLWEQPHYRHGSFQDDMKKNLRNVAIPGTGIPLSVFAQGKVLAGLFFVVLYPVIALASGIHVGRGKLVASARGYIKNLTDPNDWFGFWRLNCALASYHSSVTKEQDYACEDKFKFFEVAEEKGVEYSPLLKMPRIVCKRRNEEGGMGIAFFSNATHGGEWIIQEALTNDPKLSELLPKNAPLSTFRVITISSCKKQSIQALSCVWRAGRQGSKTDHSAILFDVDPSGKFKTGSRNDNWYQLGLDKCFTTNWATPENISHHPDNSVKVVGKPIDAKSIMNFAVQAHEKMMPRVPIVGWDVALTDKGMLMLECNLSCNFFCGSFDHKKYFSFVEEHFLWLENAERTT